MNLTSRRLVWGLCAALLVTLTTFAWALFDRWRFNSSSHDLTQQLIEDSFLNGDFQLLEQRGSDALQQQWREDSLPRFLDYVAKTLGELSAIDSIDGGSDVSLLPWQRRNAIAAYAVSLHLEDEPVEMRIEWQRIDGQWRLSSVELSAAALQN